MSSIATPSFPGFRDRVIAVWRELQASAVAPCFDNSEGGSIEQQRDRRLQLHHCANYAAVLCLLDDAEPRLRLLELGCGSGVLSHAFARLMPPGWRLDATDYSETLLRSARIRFRHERLNFRHLDVRELEPGLLDDIDAVFLLEVIEHLPEREAASLLNRLHRVMRPGARLLITTLDRSPFPRSFSGYAPHYVEYTARSLAAFLADGRSSPFEHWQVLRIVSPRIAGESVRNENRGGYVANRLQRWTSEMGQRYPWVGRARERLIAGAFRVYSRVSAPARFDIQLYLEGMDLVRDDGGAYDRDSFSLVAELRKT